MDVLRTKVGVAHGDARGIAVVNNRGKLLHAWLRNIGRVVEHQAAAVVELIAEKFRALLQQQVRDRMRGQDVYDLYHLFTMHPDLVAKDETKHKILKRLIEKSAIRNLSVSGESLANADIRRRTEEDYQNRYSEVEKGLPPFDTLYESVEEYYRSLPW